MIQSRERSSVPSWKTSVISLAKRPTVTPGSLHFLLLPDLVITDILMPGKDGIETIRELRTINPGIKIIAISGDVPFDGPSILEAARLLGADEVMEKPFRNDQFLRIVAQLLGCDVRSF
jgi:CheY-like chemotaxis protein